MIRMSTTRPQITTFHENNARRFDNIVTNAPYKPAIPFTIIIRIGLDQSTDTNLDFLQLKTTFNYCPTSPDTLVINTHFKPATTITSHTYISPVILVVMGLIIGRDENT